MELIEAPVATYTTIVCPGCGAVLRWKNGQRTKRCKSCGRRWRAKVENQKTEKPKTEKPKKEK